MLFALGIGIGFIIGANVALILYSIILTAKIKWKYKK